MTSDWIDRNDLSVYVLSGATKAFERETKNRLKKLKEDAGFVRLDGELADWVVARVQGHKRSSRGRTPATKALWRAFRAIAAAQYHLRDDDEKSAELRDLRDRIERLWHETSPQPQE
ncbi:MAG: hypothetical protein R3E98_17505 [Gemmatimonadota bacterium]|nr:hypothetical protein [Gemmatimonadota bacterium]